MVKSFDFWLLAIIDEKIRLIRVDFYEWSNINYEQEIFNAKALRSGQVYL